MITVTRLVGLGVTVVVVAAGVLPTNPGLASNPGPARVAYTSAGQALAKKVMLEKGDLGRGAKWFGGVQSRGNVPFPLPCPIYLRFAPDESDIVITGARTATWETTGLLLKIDTHILRTADMAETVWRRWDTPGFLACLRNSVNPTYSGLAAVSATRLPFPRFGSFTRAYRLVTTRAGTRYVSDTLHIASGRARIRIIASVAYQYRADLNRFEQGVAALLAERATAGTA